MIAMRAAFLGLLGLLGLAAAGDASANDSSAQLSVGGLVFNKTNDVSLESEELSISLDTVLVRYHFLNQTVKPVTLTVGFPLPDIDLSDGQNIAIPANDPQNFLGFETKVNGKPISFVIHQNAFLGDKNISPSLRRAGVPLLPIGAQQTQLKDLPTATRAQLIDQGLLLPNGTDDAGHDLYEPAWTVKTAAVRQQTFPPMSTVTVEHRYRASQGISFDTVLRKGMRQNTAMAPEVARYRKDYCISDAFLASLDKLGGSGEANKSSLQERRIDYILKTGANWAGPIKDFKLTVDKMKPDRLVSFCANDIRPVSATAVEVRAKDFTPDKDLKILVIGKF